VPDVTVDHCTLRIVRHGGWSWGAAPNTLLQSAIKVLPELIARELGQLWTEEDDDYEIAAPVRISIPIRLHELQAISNAGPPDREFGYSSEFNVLPTSSLSLPVVGQRINSAIRAALIEKCRLPEPVAEPETLLRLAEEVEQPRVRPESFVVEVLREWQKQGVLAQRLAIFAAASLDAWHDYIVKTSDAATVFRTDEIHVIESSITESTRLLPLAKATREAILRRRLIVIAEVLATFDLPRCPAMVLAKLNEVLPLIAAEASRDVAGHVTAIDREKPQPAEAQVSRVDGFEETPSRADVSAVADESLRQIVESEVTEPLKQSSGALPLPHSRADLEIPHRPGDPSAATAFGSRSVARARMRSGKTSVTALVRTENKSASAKIQTSTTSDLSEVASQSASLNPQTPAKHQPLQRIARKQRREASALPFLLLGPLSRTGYLETLAAVLEASENTEASPLFATALAYKLLAPPERGWRRDAATLSSAAAFAGLETPAPEPAVVQFAQTVSPYLSPLDATLSGALIAGHNARVPLLLLSLTEQGSSGLVLFDTEGIFPIQWASEITELRSTLIQLDSSIVFVPRASADVELLRWLTTEGLSFVTDAPPTRGETLRSIRRPPDLRWWTNDETTPDSVFAKFASSLPASVEDALALMQVLAEDRPAIPLARDSALDRHLTMAAAVALATIAWDLWKEREPTAPHVALERFADLHAHVEYTDDRVTVNLPLGKRFLDLRDHRLLEDVDDVPWFNGRKLIFTSG
jgi:hypothetical protein